MLIFNTTFLVSDALHGKWMKWVKEEHIPFMLTSETFTQPQLAKVYSQEDQEGTSFSLQFLVSDLSELEKWHMDYAVAFEKIMLEKFGSEVLFFATILEIID